MKKLILLSAIIAFVSCKKSDDTPTNPPAPTPVNNGPLGGTYTYKSSNLVTNDTIIEPASGPTPAFEVATERTYTNTSCTGSLTITATNIKSQALSWNYATAGTVKRKNLSTMVTTTSNLLSGNDSRNVNGASYNSNYVFSIAGSQLQIIDAQYLFVPSFQSLPTDGKYNYSVIGNDLTVVIDYYSAANKFRSRTTSVFTKN
jgi:hypothetical protein